MVCKNMAKPPPSIPPTTAENPLSVSLLLGSFEHTPAKYDLFELFLPASQPAPEHELEHTFHPQPEIHHTFRPEQKVPPRFISAVGAVVVLVPWVALVGFVRRHYRLYASITHKPPCIVGTHQTERPSTVLHQHLPLHRHARCIRDSSLLVLGRPQAGSSVVVRWYFGTVHCRGRKAGFGHER